MSEIEHFLCQNISTKNFFILTPFPPFSVPTPTQLRDLAVSEKICTFADDILCPPRRDMFNLNPFLIMSKGNMFLGRAAGKVGSVVFSVVDGKQVTRALPSSVKNPRTIGQNTQRAIFATIAKAASAMNAIVDHSYVNVAYGPKSIRNFRKLNLDNLRNLYLNTQHAVAFTPKGGGFVPNNYIIAKGNLPSFTETDTDGSLVRFEQGGEIVSLPEGQSGITWTQFKKRYPYIQPGDQLTICRIVKTGDGSLAQGSAGFTFTYDRIVLSSDEALLNSLPYVLYTFGFNGDALDLTVTTSANALRLTEGGGSVWIGLGADNAIVQGIYAVGLILSRKVNGTWQRSDTTMTVINADDMQDVDSAIASYDGTTDSILSDTEYLNQAINSSSSVDGVKGPYLLVIDSTGDSAEKNAGETGEIGAKELEDGLSITAQAYGTDANKLMTLELSGTNADGEYFDYKQAVRNKSSLTFSPGDDANFAGTYKFTALFKDMTKAELTFRLSVPE